MSTAIIDLPKKVVVQDYHTFEIIRMSLKSVGVQCNIHDTGINERLGYVGVVYTGSLNDAENQKFITNITVAK